MEAVRLYKCEELKDFIIKSAIGLDEEELDVLLKDKEFLTQFIIDDLKETHENL